MLTYILVKTGTPIIIFLFIYILSLLFVYITQGGKHTNSLSSSYFPTTTLCGRLTERKLFAQGHPTGFYA